MRKELYTVSFEGGFRYLSKQYPHGIILETPGLPDCSSDEGEYIDADAGDARNSTMHSDVKEKGDRRRWWGWRTGHSTKREELKLPWPARTRV